MTVLWVNDHTLVWTFHTYDLDASAESPTFTLRTTVSEDGKAMTGIGSDGSVQVFEKQWECRRFATGEREPVLG